MRVKLLSRYVQTLGAGLGDQALNALYAAPEASDGDDSDNSAADIYSFGLIAMEVIV